MTERINDIASLLMGLATDLQVHEDRQKTIDDSQAALEAKLSHCVDCLALEKDAAKLQASVLSEREAKVKVREDNLVDTTRVAANRLAKIKMLEAEVADLLSERKKRVIAESALRQCLQDRERLEKELAAAIKILKPNTQVLHELEAQVEDEMRKDALNEENLARVN